MVPTKPAKMFDMPWLRSSLSVETLSSDKLRASAGTLRGTCKMAEHGVTLIRVKIWSQLG